MPSHPDRVRRSYTQTEIFNWKSIIDHDDHFMIKVTTCDIATCMSKRDFFYMLVNKLRAEILK